MCMHANGTFEVTAWDEHPCDVDDEAFDGTEVIRVNVRQAFHGDIEGEGSADYLMLYEGSDACFVSTQRIVGRVCGREGSFMLSLMGTYERWSGRARATGHVVPTSGTGYLCGIQGEGGFTAPDSSIGSITLDYDFEGMVGQSIPPLDGVP